MQWQQMDWPIAIDPLNLLELSGVPIVTAIDEHGVSHRVDQENFQSQFIDREFPSPRQPLDTLATQKPDLDALEMLTAGGKAETWAKYGAALFLWGGEERIDAAVEAFRRAVALEPQDGRWHFRLGVCLRRRYESEDRRPGDFQAAVDEWSRALELDPNQYIWRRRIEQYGPRLQKPYPFYDWVERARLEIIARGEVPVALAVEPTGAEFAEPLKSLAGVALASQNPDPNGVIARDDEHFVHIEVVAVPANMTPGSAARVHVILRPDPIRKAHWNNEVDDLQLWIEALPGWALEANLHTVANPIAAVSRETRRLDFEVTCGEGTPSGEVSLPAYALYFVCEDEKGTCLYRRQELGFSCEFGSRSGEYLEGATRQQPDVSRGDTACDTTDIAEGI